jgi:hypothetical protein
MVVLTLISFYVLHLPLLHSLSLSFDLSSKRIYPFLLNCHLAPALSLYEEIGSDLPNDVISLACPVNARYLSLTRFTCMDEKQNLIQQIVKDDPSRPMSASPLGNQYRIILSSIETTCADGHSMQLCPISGTPLGQSNIAYYAAPLTTDVIRKALQFFNYEWRENLDEVVNSIFKDCANPYDKLRGILKQQVPRKSTESVLQTIAYDLMLKVRAKIPSAMTPDAIEGNDSGLIDPMHTIKIRDFIVDSLVALDGPTKESIFSGEAVSQELSTTHFPDDCRDEVDSMFFLYLSYLKSIFPQDNNLDSLKVFIQTYLVPKLNVWREDHKNEKLWGDGLLENHLNGKIAVNKTKKFLRRFINWNLAKFSRIVSHLFDGNHRWNGLNILLAGVNPMVKYRNSDKEVDEYFFNCPHKHFRLDVDFHLPHTSISSELCTKFATHSAKIQERTSQAVAHGPREWYRLLRNALTDVINSSDIKRDGFPLFQPSLETLLTSSVSEKAEQAILAFGFDIKNEENEDQQDSEELNELRDIENKLREVCKDDCAHDVDAVKNVYCQLWTFHLLYFIWKACSNLEYSQSIVQDSTSRSQERIRAFEDRHEFRSMFRRNVNKDDSEEVLCPFLLGCPNDNAFSYYLHDLQLSQTSSRYFRKTKLPFLDVDIALIQILVISFWSDELGNFCCAKLETSNPTVRQQCVGNGPRSFLTERWFCLLLMSVSGTVDLVVRDYSPRYSVYPAYDRFRASAEAVKHSLDLFSRLGDDPKEDEGFVTFKEEINCEKNLKILMETVGKKILKSYELSTDAAPIVLADKTVSLDLVRLMEFFNGTVKEPIKNQLEFLVLWHSYNMKSCTDKKNEWASREPFIEIFYNSQDYKLLTNSRTPHEASERPERSTCDIKHVNDMIVGRIKAFIGRKRLNFLFDTRETGKKDLSREDDESEITSNDADEQIASSSPVVQKKKKRKYAGRTSSQGKAPKRKIPKPPDDDHYVVSSQVARKAVEAINEVTTLVSSRPNLPILENLARCIDYLKSQPRAESDSESSIEDRIEESDESMQESGGHEPQEEIEVCEM